MKNERTLNFFSIAGKTYGFYPHTTCYKVFRELLDMLRKAQGIEAKKKVFIEYNAPIPADLQEAGLNLVTFYMKYQELISSVSLHDENGNLIPIEQGLKTLLGLKEAHKKK